MILSRRILINVSARTKSPKHSINQKYLPLHFQNLRFAEYSSEQGLIVVNGPSVYDQFALGKEVAVRLDLPRRFYYLLLLLRAQLWQVVDEIPRVRRPWDDEAEVKAVLADDLAAEIMLLDHLHVFHLRIADAELQVQSDRAQEQKLRTEVVFDDTRVRVVWIGKILLVGLGRDGDQRHIAVAISDAEALELKLRPVVGEFAQETVRRLLQRFHVINGDLVIIWVLLWSLRHLLTVIIFEAQLIHLVFDVWRRLHLL